MSPKKESVRAHWEAETCGTRYGVSEDRRTFLDQTAKERYRLEPFIHEFANFESARGLRVLEIGVGGGADFENWTKHAAFAVGVDITAAGIDLTVERMSMAEGPRGSVLLARADAENLPFADASFDLVYSWGVLHHTPDTAKALSEVSRVLKPGGGARIMVYHVPSWTGLSLAMLYGLKGKRPISQQRAIFRHLESPGTKAYSIAAFRKVLVGAGLVVGSIGTKLGPGDLLTIAPSQRYEGGLFRLIWKHYPRPLVKLLGDRFGLYLLAECRKP